MISITFKGLDELKKYFKNSPEIMEREIGIALGRSIAMFGTEMQRRTPVDTGLLKSSIGSETFGYKFVRGLTAGIGTNIRYAVYVNDGHGAHTTGERQFVEKGLVAGTPFFHEEMKKAMKRLADKV